VGPQSAPGWRPPRTRRVPTGVGNRLARAAKLAASRATVRTPIALFFVLVLAVAQLETIFAIYMEGRFGLDVREIGLALALSGRLVDYADIMKNGQPERPRPAVRGTPSAKAAELLEKLGAVTSSVP